MAERSAPVALVNMPFGMLTNPPLGLGLLKAGLARREVRARVLNLNLRFGQMLGPSFYERMAMSGPTLLAGEWAFSSALWGTDPTSDSGYFRDVFARFPAEQPSPTPASADSGEPAPAQASRSALFYRARNLVEPFLEDCLSEYHEVWQSSRLVGFTSVFEQHTASLALARRLKERYPHLFIVMGGANCEGPMGEATLEAFPFLDAVCSGEGDNVFPEFVERLFSGATLDGIPGFRHRRSAVDAAPSRRSLPTLGATAANASAATNSVHDMDALPYPDFDEYFADVQAIDVEPRLMFETSRGCWWGAKQHCTFCGLNGSSIAFRAKSAERAMAELLHLLERYGDKTRAISAVDNIIPLQYFRDFLPMLREMKLDLQLFYETKANLKKEQIELYREAGLTTIQPGIESLSSPVLRLMRKGVTQLQNVQLLKWCKQYGVHPVWNYLVGFPGEHAEDYRGQDQLVRSIAHLTPPDGHATVRFDRFSPYFMNPEQFGLRNLRPYPSYRYVYRGVDERLRHELAYYFEADYDGKESIGEYSSALAAAIDDWIANGADYALFSLEVGSHLQIFDLRPGAPSFVATLDGPSRAVYLAADGIVGRGQLSDRLAQPGASRLPERAIDEALTQLLERRLLLREGEHFLSLGVPLGAHYAPSGTVRQRFLTVMRALS
jgi:ribosomal peptide maturation radical SAM protein 1